MKSQKFLFAGLALALAIASGASAQFDTNGPNAAMTVQGTLASAASATTHDINVAVPGAFRVDVKTGSNANQGVIMLGSTVNPNGALVLPTPWGGGLNIGAFNPVNLLDFVFIMGDGVSLSANPLIDLFFRSNASGDMKLQVTLAAGLAGQRFAIQCIAQDPTNPPFFFDNTEAADCNFQSGQQLVVLTGDDGNIAIPFQASNGFNFHGVNYTEVYIEGNGTINFGGTNLHAAGGFYVEGNAALVADKPGIYLNRSDWNPASVSAADGILYEEFGGSARISWGHPLSSATNGSMSHFGESDSNRFDVVLQLDTGSNPNEGEFRITEFFLDETSTDGIDAMFGHSPGGLAGNPASFIDSDTLRTSVTINGAGEAQLIEHRAGNGTTDIGWNGTGASRNYVNFARNLNGHDENFLPQTNVIAGDLGYVAFPMGPLPADDFTKIDLVSLDSAGGETVTAYGSFFGFDPTVSGAGTVTLDPAGLAGGPYACGVVGILDNTGTSGALSLPHATPSADRDGEAMQFVTPAGPFPAGTMQLEIAFASGFIKTINVLILPAGGAFTSYTLADDGFVAHTFTSVVPVFYGVAQPGVSICSNGQIIFGPGTTQFANTEALAFDGWVAGTAAPSVALYATDLNNGGTASGATYTVLEDPGMATATIEYRNQNHWDGNTPAGTFSATFGLAGQGSVTLDYTSFIPNTDPNAIDGIIGVSDGDNTVGTDTSLTNGNGDGVAMAILGGFTAAAVLPESIIETIPAGGTIGGGTGIQVYTFLDTAVMAPFGSFVIF